MELCCPQRALPTLRRHHRSPPLILPTSHLPLLLSSASPLPPGKSLEARFKPGCLNIPRVRATDSGDTSTVVSEERYGTTPVTVEEPSYTAGTTEEAPVGDGERIEALDFLNKLDLKFGSFGSEGTFDILIYGTGALAALWITSAIVAALDSIPLFPKLMEVVGLGFTVWFSARYLVFKDNRDELFAQIETLKDRIVGLGDD